MNNDRVHDRITEAFIDERRVSIRLRRRKKQTQPGGGWKWVVDRTLAPQECRLIYQGNVSNANQRTLPGGRIVNVEANLVFPLGADVQVPDTFELNGEEWEVVRTITVFDVIAEVIKYG